MNIKMGLFPCEILDELIGSISHPTSHGVHPLDGDMVTIPPFWPPKTHEINEGLKPTAPNMDHIYPKNEGHVGSPWQDDIGITVTFLVLQGPSHGWHSRGLYGSIFTGAETTTCMMLWFAYNEHKGRQENRTVMMIINHDHEENDDDDDGQFPHDGTQWDAAQHKAVADLGSGLILSVWVGTKQKVD